MPIFVCLRILSPKSRQFIKLLNLGINNHSLITRTPLPPLLPFAEQRCACRRDDGLLIWPQNQALTSQVLGASTCFR